ncbi:hypothetical protein D8S82_06010 [Mycobacterium hodleri]|uniref:Uncharacterized protein n=1 Tax=Mycolicibacterium hodleri TaxID=49897 RepID=A0A544W659_9MYCO|nr:hypothetical protein [Mycolicibacterium hodleri]TQR87734.1 hypothetical protein D8S82_06010 [Mycolicibacterium hodleri]
MSKQFNEFTFGTDDPTIQYVDPDGNAPSVGFRLDGNSDTRTANVAKVLISDNGDFDSAVIEGHLFMNAAQLRKLGHDATRAADLLGA